MKTKWLFYLISFFTVALFSSCDNDDELNLNNPDVGTFVNLLKKGEYPFYAKGDGGENLWLLMPKFTKEHIPELLEYAKDTTHIKSFPTNPISSKGPFAPGRDYYILGEGLLWIVQGIRSGSEYGSLVPYMVKSDQSEGIIFTSLTTSEILEVRTKYLNWWKSYNDKASSVIADPLENTKYQWH